MPAKVPASLVFVEHRIGGHWFVVTAFFAAAVEPLPPLALPVASALDALKAIRPLLLNQIIHAIFLDRKRLIKSSMVCPVATLIFMEIH